MLAVANKQYVWATDFRQTTVSQLVEPTHALDELRTVVATQIARRPSYTDQSGQHIDYPARSNDPPTSMASASRVYSSTAVKHLICCPLAKASKTKS